MTKTDYQSNYRSITSTEWLLWYMWPTHTRIYDECISPNTCTCNMDGLVVTAVQVSKKMSICINTIHSIPLKVQLYLFLQINNFRI